MSIQDNIKVQQAFVRARLEYESQEQERQQKIKEKAHDALLVRQKQAEERSAEIERIKNDPERMKKWKDMFLMYPNQNITYNLEVYYYGRNEYQGFGKRQVCNAEKKRA